MLQLNLNRENFQQKDKKNCISTLLSSKLVLDHQNMIELPERENVEPIFLENHSNNDSDDDVEIQVYSKSDSEGIVMAILEDTVEAVMERGVPWPCRHRMPDEILSEGFLPDPEGETQEIHQTPIQNLRESMPHIFLVAAILLAILGHSVFGALVLAVFIAHQILPGSPGI